MARTVFFSFHYQRDIWRVNQIRSIPNITGNAAEDLKMLPYGKNQKRKEMM